MQRALRVVDDTQRATPTAAPDTRDWFLLAVIVSAMLVEAAVRPELPLATIVIGLATVPTVLWRRTHPLLMVALGFGVSIALSVFRLTIDGDFLVPHTTAFLIVLPFALTRRGSGRAIAIGSGIIAVSAALGFLADRLPLGDIVGGTAVLLVVMTAGAAVRFRARARFQEIEQAKSREREQIARDLHDTVAHHVSAIAIRAQAGLATSTQTDAATDALRDIEAEASRALADMRRMVRVLRTDAPAERTPTPGIADLELLRRTGDGGPRVDVRITGSAGELTAPVATTIYRLAQEAVTNARRHAEGATLVAVELDVGDQVVRLQVTDDGDAPRARDGAGSGYGLVGMGERAEMLGGAFEAGPGAQRGWRVTVVVPRHAVGT